MRRADLDALIACLVIGGALAGLGLVAWLVHVNVDAGAIAAVATLEGTLLGMGASIVRNRFPGPEIDVVPPSMGPTGGGCTCGQCHGGGTE